jgi:hypothetical protein
MAISTRSHADGPGRGPGPRARFARYLGLTDEDLAVLGPVMLLVAGVVIRAGVFAPDTVRDLLDADEQDEP